MKIISMATMYSMSLPILETVLSQIWSLFRKLFVESFANICFIEAIKQAHESLSGLCSSWCVQV